MTNLNSIIFIENKYISSIQNNNFKENQIQPCLLNDSILNDSFSDNDASFQPFANQDNFINKQIEINYIASLIQNNPLNMTFPFSLKETYSENREDIIINLPSNNSKSKSNITQDTKDINFEKKTRQLIFKIQKDNKKIGRIKKNTIYVGKHNRFCEDNIIRKIKGRFHEKCRIAINNEYRKYLINNNIDLKKENDLLQRITPKVSRKIKKDENLKWLRSRIYQVFSEEVSVKCSLYKSDHNKINIQKLYKENKAKDVIAILNKPVKEMFNDYVLNKNMPGLNLNDDLKELKIKMEKDNDEDIDKYLFKYKNTALNLESIFKKKFSRNK